MQQASGVTGKGKHQITSQDVLVIIGMNHQARAKMVQTISADRRSVTPAGSHRLFQLELGPVVVIEAHPEKQGHRFYLEADDETMLSIALKALAERDPVICNFTPLST